MTNYFTTKKGLKLKRITIKEFKLFKDFNISFLDKDKNILPLIILAGNNGSGKTTLLETIFSKYYQNLKQPVAGFRFHEEDKNYHLLGLKIYHNITFNGENRVINDYLNKNDELAKYIINIPFFECNTNLQDSFLKKIENFIPFFIDRLIYEHDILASVAYKKVEEYIKGVLEDLELGFSFSRLDASKQVYFKNNQSKEFKIDDLSSGEKTIFVKILFLYFGDFKDSVILIDEPELSLHPIWQSKILKLYEKYALKNNCQIILATHSPFIIGSAKAKYLRVLHQKNNKIEVYDDFNKSYGLEFHKILVDIMGVQNLRVPEIDEKFDLLKEYIKEKKWENFNKLFKDLEKILCKDDTDLQLLKLEANLKGLKDVKSN